MVELEELLFWKICFGTVILMCNHEKTTCHKKETKEGFVEDPGIW